MKESSSTQFLYLMSMLVSIIVNRFICYTNKSIVNILFMARMLQGKYSSTIKKKLFKYLSRFVEGIRSCAKGGERGYDKEKRVYFKSVHEQKNVELHIW